MRGIEVFRKYFAAYSGQYVLIGGTACDLVFQDNGLTFRPTKDFDVVLVAEALTKEFVRQFWSFIKSGGYEIKQRGDGSPIFYRFQKPKDEQFPFMIELLSRDKRMIHPELEDGSIIKMAAEEEIASLSAILLNEDYYQLIQKGTVQIAGVSVLSDAYLLLFKAKAWLDLSSRKAKGDKIQNHDIHKHKNDVVRLSLLLLPSKSMILPDAVKTDMGTFLSAYEADPSNLIALGIQGIDNTEIIRRLRLYYSL